jgi:hypothetical protein
MQTSVNLDDPLLPAVKRRAVAQQIRLARVIENARRGLLRKPRTGLESVRLVSLLEPA